MAGAASQAGDADSSRAPGLTSGLQGSVNVHRGTLLLVPQWQCISSFVFYIVLKLYFMQKFKISYPAHNKEITALSTFKCETKIVEYEKLICILIICNINMNKI